MLFGRELGFKPSREAHADCLHCTYSGAKFASKKTLILAQNLENKGPEFFLPPRSMVLKVVTGKILETLELSGCPTACGSVLGQQ
jgi:hypothetical protein